MMMMMTILLQRRIAVVDDGKIIRRRNERRIGDEFEVVLADDEFRTLKERGEAVALVEMRLRGDELQQLERRQSTLLDDESVEATEDFDFGKGLQRFREGGGATERLVKTIKFAVEALEVVESAPDDDLDARVGVLPRETTMSHFV